MGRMDICNGRIGTSFEAKNWRSLSPVGLLGISCSLAVHVFAYYVIATDLIEASFVSTALFVLVYTPIAMLALSSLYMAWITDPGAVPMGARPLVVVKRASSNTNPNSNTSSEGDLSGSTNNNNNNSNNRKTQRAVRRCHKCNDNFKPSRAHHDSITGRCIVKFDHFCPWVGNAIGALNHKFFVLFIGYTFCSCLLSLVLLLIRAIHCGFVTNDDNEQEDDLQGSSPTAAAGGGDDTTAINSDMDENSTIDDNNNTNVEGDHYFLRHLGRFLETSTTTTTLDASYRPECTAWYTSWASLLLFIVSIIFLTFTFCMLLEQVEAIATNASKIARMKMRVGQAGTELARVTEEFNEMFGGDTAQVSWHWFLPMTVEFPRGMKKVVLGYEWDETFDPIPYEEPNNNHHHLGHDEEAAIGGSGAGTLVSGTTPRTDIGGKIELTTHTNGLTRPTSPPALTEEIEISGGLEGTFSGTPVVLEQPKLKQRANSRGPDGRLKVNSSLDINQGAFT